MKHPMIRSRRMRYGGMTVYLTVALITALVLLNAIFSALANYKSWYIDMTAERLYSVSDLCYELLDAAIEEAEAESGKSVKAEIIFCEDYRNYEKGSVGYYIYTTAHELEQAYPDNISISWFDCWVEKSRAVELGVTASTNVVLLMEDGQKRVFGQKEFFTFETGNTTSPIGYDGERMFATTLASFIGGDRPLAVLTTNHEELYYDNSLMLSLRDAGYNIRMLDLYYEDIPAECELLVCYNPNNDFIVSDGISEVDEIDKLTAYLEGGGDMMVFLSASSPELPEFEGLLADWGVSIGRIYDKDTGVPYNAMVKDTSVSLTADGFTIYGEYVTEGHGAAITSILQESDYTPRAVFSDATVLLASEGYTAAGNATYQKGDRTRSDVFLASPRARAWACGAQLEGYDAPIALMSVTTDASTGSRVMVCSSIEFASEAYLKSPVFGNNDVLLSVEKDMGLDNVLIGLRHKPFTTDTISSITTAQMLRWTLGLTLTPAILILAVATFVLVRRKYS